MEEEQISSSGVPSIELVQSISKCIQETKQIVKEVAISKSNFLMLAFYLGELQPLVEDLSKEDQQLLNSFPIWTALNRLETAANAVRRFTKACTSRSRIFLLNKVNSLLKDIRRLVRDVAEGLSIMSDSLPSKLKDGFNELREKLDRAGFYMEPFHQQLADEIGQGLAAHHVDEPFATTLLRKIAETLQVPLPAAAELKLELQRDLETVELEAGHPDLEALKNLCELLAPAAVLADVRRLAVEENGFSRYGSLSVNSSFICPITAQVMQDPVMLVEAGFTYEREAIAEWFKRGHKTCPDTGKELESLELVPNNNLRQAIEEFSDRASRGDLTDAIDTIREREQRNLSESEIEDAVETMKSLSDTNPKYKRLIASMEGIQPLVGIVKQQKEKMPKVWDKSLKLLVNIAAIGDEYRILMKQAGVVPPLIRHLWRTDGENLMAMQLLYEISKVEEGVSGIIESEKFIVCIARATNAESAEVKAVATKILDNICHNRPEVAIKVASYQVFGPLVAMLSTGSTPDIRAGLARAVVELELNEEGYNSLVTTGVIPPLLDLLRNGSEQSEIFAAAQALQHLSSMESCRVTICKAGAIPALVHFLSSDNQEVRLAVMGTVANLATDREGAIEIDQEGAVLRLLSMLKQDLDIVMHEYALKTLECMAKESKTVRLTVKEHNEGTYLLDLLQARDLTDASRTSILHLLSHLADDRECRECVTLSNETIEFLITISNTTVQPKEQEAIMGIFAGQSKMPQGMEFLSTPSVVEFLVSFLDRRGSMKTKEYAVLALLKILESSNVDLVQVASGAMPALKGLLTEGSVQAKCSAASLLGVFSKHTPSLSEKLTFGQKVAGYLGVRKFRRCKVHPGKCNPKKTLCIVESGAAVRLIALLDGTEVRSAERAVEALATLLENDENKSRALYFLVKSNIIPALVIVSGKSTGLTERSVRMLEQIFRDRRFRDEKYYSGAQTVMYKLVAASQGNTRKAAAQTLEHLGLFPKGSTYTA